MAGISEREMTIVHKARAESRVEVMELEKLKQQIRASYLLRKENSENDFVQRWPEICSEVLRQRALTHRAR